MYILYILLLHTSILSIIAVVVLQLHATAESSHSCITSIKDHGINQDDAASNPSHPKKYGASFCVQLICKRTSLDNNRDISFLDTNQDITSHEDISQATTFIIQQTTISNKVQLMVYTCVCNLVYKQHIYLLCLFEYVQ